MYEPTEAMKQADADAKGWFFPDGEPVGEWVVICTNPACLRCGRNPERLTCPTCGSEMIRTIDYLAAQKEQTK